MSDRFIANNIEKVDHNARSTYYFEMCARWLGMRLDLIVAIMVTATATVLVLAPVPPSIAGIALVYSFQMATLFQWLVRVSIETENQFTSVERLLHYSRKLPREGDFYIDGKPHYRYFFVDSLILIPRKPPAERMAKQGRHPLR